MCCITDILYFQNQESGQMDSIRIRINQLLPTLTKNTSKEIPVKDFKKARLNSRYYSQFEKQKPNKIQEVSIEDYALRQKIKKIKQMQKQHFNTEAHYDYQSLQTIQKQYKLSPETASLDKSQSSNVEKLSKIFRSLQKFKKLNNKQDIKDKQKSNARLKSPVKKQRKQRKKSPQKLSNSVRRYKDHLSFDQKLQNRSIAKKIQKIKPSREVSLLKLKKQYEQHQIHVHLRENYLQVVNRNHQKRLFFA